jgi:hypothetical protein
MHIVSICSDVGGDCLTLSVEHVSENDLCPFAGKEPSFGLALPACCSRDDDNLAVESTHDSP